MDISFIRDQIKNDLDEYYYIKDKPFKNIKVWNIFIFEFNKKKNQSFYESENNEIIKDLK